MMPAQSAVSIDESMQLINAARDAVDPARAVHLHVHRSGHLLWVDQQQYDLKSLDKLVLIAVGKAAVPMALAICEILGDDLAFGVVVTKYGHTGDAQKQLQQSGLVVHEAGHPVPDRSSAIAGDLVCQAVNGCTAQSLVLACISGGASALMIAPIAGVRLQTMQAINAALLKAGADIREMNIVRSRIDRLKAGGLVRQSAPGRVVGLILSDVVGDPLDVIASGLTNAPEAHNVLVANNTQACEAVLVRAQQLGYTSSIVTTELHGEARERGIEIVHDISVTPCGTCLIYGGETIVNIRGNGKGGRNQELALAAAIEMQTGQLPGIRIIAFGTDGTDGPTDAAGAIAYHDTCQRAQALGLSAADYLQNNDSYSFFNTLGDLLFTGPTGTNVADVVIALHEHAT